MKPDFSGKWKFNRNRSDLQITPPDSSSFVIEHHEPNFRLTRTLVFGEKSDSFTIDLVTDGKEIILERDDMRIHARLYWENDALVFVSRLERGDETAANLVKYKLADDQSSFTADERFRSKSLNYDNIWVLDRE